MNSCENEKLIDELIGEALLFLLKQKDPINILALIAQLHIMKNNEMNDQRREMIVRLIEDISSNKIAAVHNKQKTEQNEGFRDTRDNVYPLFGNRQRQDRSKKH